MAGKAPASRIDWFDGSVVEGNRASADPRAFANEEKEETPTSQQPAQYERKLMGFMKLQELSTLEPNVLPLKLTARSSFWDLLNTKVTNDFIVLLVRILSKFYTFLASNPISPALDHLLKTKFIPSMFLETTLPEYMKSLPNTRLSDKRMNMQFWNDIELFYSNVITLCIGLVTTDLSLYSKAMHIVEGLLTSSSGVMENHNERFSDSFITRIAETLCRFDNFKLQLKEKDKKEQPLVNLTIKDLNIFPTKEDLLGNAPDKIDANIIDGAYSSVEHYLEVQFKLLREDCFGPVRKGLAKYRENPESKLENIRLHKRVRIVGTYVTKMKVGHLVDIAWQQRNHQTSVDFSGFAKERQLMFGSLVLLTSDNFQTVLFATVIDSDVKILSLGYVAVQFFTPISSSSFNEKFIMIESEVFFEPYHRVLKVLQSFTTDIPMKRYIVQVQKETKPPAYATSYTEYILRSGFLQIPYRLLDTKSWPSKEHFGLDETQMKAFELALTREFAVIQGPPGTGKTFMGVKVATTILQNLSLTCSPMLIVCFTNHALDQFLEGIAKVTESIVRLGSQTKNPEFEKYTLRSWKMKCKSKNYHLFAEKRAVQEKLFDKMAAIQCEVDKCENEILCYQDVKHYLGLGTHLSIERGFEDPILTWLFYHLYDNLESEDIRSKGSLENQHINDMTRQECVLETCFSEKWAEQEIDSLKKNIKYVKDVVEDDTTRDSMVEKLEEKIGVIGRYLKEFKKSQRLKDCEWKNFTVEDPYSLSPTEKWIIYFNAANKVKIQIMQPMTELQTLLDSCNKELEEIECLVDAEAIKSARVIAATTTLAARRHLLLKSLNSSIVIVEEAAQVLEAHIVASLTHRCQHVILIGDHKQLKPSTSYYELTKDTNLDISLFERMIRNGVHARTLTTQRRMRKEFVELLVPTIYDKLDCHPSVFKYPDVKGVDKNLFFCTHNHFEDEKSDVSSSYRNTPEAELCVSFAKYLRRKYAASEITIIATYLKQTEIIKKLSEKEESMRNVTITTVDNYQGEENRIVILSLVRSKKYNNIGFLKTANRICVALSRAKEGFYIFGNMSCLTASSTIWQDINEKLIHLDCIGDHIPLSQNDDEKADVKSEDRNDQSSEAVEGNLSNSMSQLTIANDRPCVCV